MNKIIALIIISLLISCGNQQGGETEQGGVEKQADEKFSDTGAETKTQGPILLSKEQDETQSGEAMKNEIAHLFNQGTRAYDNDDFEGGISYFEQIVEKDPTERRAWYNLGLGYFRVNRFDKSLQAFTRAIEIAPDDSLSIQYRGRVYYMMNDFQNCLKDYERVIELKPNDPVAYYNRGTARGQIRDYLGAIMDFDKAISLNPDYAEAFFNRGLANYLLDRVHEACYDWRKAHLLGHYEADKAIRSYCGGDDD